MLCRPTPRTGLHDAETEGRCHGELSRTRRRLENPPGPRVNVRRGRIKAVNTHQRVELQRAARYAQEARHQGDLRHFRHVAAALSTLLYRASTAFGKVPPRTCPSPYDLSSAVDECDGQHQAPYNKEALAYNQQRPGVGMERRRDFDGQDDHEMKCDDGEEELRTGQFGRSQAQFGDLQESHVEEAKRRREARKRQSEQHVRQPQRQLDGVLSRSVGIGEKIRRSRYSQ